MKEILGINYYFQDSDKNNAVFDESRTDMFARGFVIRFKKWIEQHYDISVQTWDCILRDPEQVKAVLYFDYSWRYALKDNILKHIPFEKRALMMIEPANVNPSLYYVPFYRNRFKTIFTWDERLIRQNRNYIPINVPVGAEPSSYKENRFATLPFLDKKLLIAVSRNRWSYMPNSTYKKRVATYRHFSTTLPDQFDLYGQGWAHTGLTAYRGEIVGSWDNKVAVMAKYKYAICFENNVSQPGYISEKILDCFCARCVPIYYGSAGIEKRIPRDCFIDFKDFHDLDELERYIVSLPENRHAEYINAINRFMTSDMIDYFSTEHYFRTLAEGLQLPAKSGITS